MSTLKVSTIQDTSGNNSSTPNEVAQGRAKAWISFNAIPSTPVISDSFNVSSITDHAQGDHTINFANAMANADYVMVGTLDNYEGTAGDSYGIIAGQSNDPLTTTGFRVTTLRAKFNLNPPQLKDFGHVMCVVFGD